MIFFYFLFPSVFFFFFFSRNKWIDAGERNREEIQSNEESKFEYHQWC